MDDSTGDRLVWVASLTSRLALEAVILYLQNKRIISMNLAALFALLLQSGACAPTDFQGTDGSKLTIMICPMLKPAPAAPSEDAPASNEERKPPVKPAQRT